MCAYVYIYNAQLIIIHNLYTFAYIHTHTHTHICMRARVYKKICESLN